MASTDSTVCPEVSISPPAQVVADLRRQLQEVEGFSRPRHRRGVSTGILELDALLPGGRLLLGSLMEWLAPVEGSGAEELSLRVAWNVSRETLLVVVDPPREVYPPALVHLGMDLRRIVFLHPHSIVDMHWAICQALGSAAVGAVWGRISSLSSAMQRRFQLAAERGGTVGVFVRSVAVRKEPSWAELRFMVTPKAWSWEETGSQRRCVAVSLLRAPGQRDPCTKEIWIDDPTDSLLEPCSQKVQGHHRVRRSKAVGA